MNSNNYNKQKIRAIIRKIEMIEMKGGGCNNCGYNRNLAALEFHHINPKYKSFKLDMRKISNCTLEKLKEEFEKCELLCSNCHREHHNRNLEISLIKERMDLLYEDKKTFSNSKPLKKLNCEVCDIEMDNINGKRFCSDNCRYSHHPPLIKIDEEYENLKSWDKVAKKLNTTRKIIYNIRKRNNKL